MGVAMLDPRSSSAAARTGLTDTAVGPLTSSLSAVLLIKK